MLAGWCGCLQALHLGYNRIAEAADLDRLEGELRAGQCSSPTTTVLTCRTRARQEVHTNAWPLLPQRLSHKCLTAVPPPKKQMPLGLSSLVEITLVNNPVTRKQTYRAVLINRCPSLCVADGQVSRAEVLQAALSLGWLAGLIYR